ncbi:hypothetical protein AQ866_18105 [Burkholderia pseudomallei]|nr:hypothetical protein AQ866_18105 [Burkholderia pseudomallei]
MAKTNKNAVQPLASHFVAEVNRPDRNRIGTRISDAMELLDSLHWAADKAMSDDDYWLVLSLFRASLPSIGAALEAANDALGESRPAERSCRCLARPADAPARAIVASFNSSRVG